MPTSTVEITAANFEGYVQNGIVLLDWGAPWCGPCRVFAPTYEEVARRHPDIVFGTIDTQAQTALTAAYNVRVIPMLMVIRDGILLFAKPGVRSAAALEDLVSEVRALDIAALRRKAAETNAHLRALATAAT